MFTGEYQHKLDNKGRVILPKKLRHDPEPIQAFMLTVSLDNCIAAYTMEAWDNFTHGMEPAPWEDKSVRAYKRLIFANAVLSEPDRQGRIFLPLNLRSYAQIQKEIVIAGAGNHIEIWDKRLWEEYDHNSEQEFVEHAGKIPSYGKKEK